MALLVHNCPRCGSKKITFDVIAQNVITARAALEIFSICRRCGQSVTFTVLQTKVLFDDRGNEVALSHAYEPLNEIAKVTGYIALKDMATGAPPEHCPPAVEAAFREGATCLAVKCPNAAGTMFRLCVDLATRGMLPEEGAEGGPNAKQQRDLGLRLPWLFDHGKLPEALRDLSHCIKEDGNDGAHAGTLQDEDAQELLDFTTALLERVYTEPAKLQLAKERRDQRRAAGAPAAAAKGRP
jgi:Domain of unknown function (DUF4145)